jgi:hypothetical protein
MRFQSARDKPTRLVYLHSCISFIVFKGRQGVAIVLEAFVYTAHTCL